MMSCLSSLLEAVLGEGRQEPDEVRLLRGRLMVSEAAAAADAEAIRGLLERVEMLQRGLAAASDEKEAAEARRRETEKRAEDAELELEVVVNDVQFHVEELREKMEEMARKDSRIRELEAKIQGAGKRRWY